MKLEMLQALVFSVPGRFKIATSDTRFSHHCVIGLTLDGVAGWGSGVLYGKRPLETAALLRREVFPFLASMAFEHIDSAREALQERFLARDSAAVFALDSALWDIQGKLAGQPICQLLGRPLRTRIPITEQVFIQEEPAVEREIDTILAHGTRQIKVKIGLDPRQDIARLQRLRARLGSQVQLGVDANGGYSFEQAVWVGKELKALDVRLLEDPLPVREWGRIPALREATGLLILQDAGIRFLADLQRVQQLRAADVLNLKLTRIGGLTAALTLAKACQEAGIGLSVGCAEDLGMGMASILHLSAVLARLHSTEGVGAYRLGFDIVAEPSRIEAGSLAVPAAPGLGVTFDPARLQEAARRRDFRVGDAQQPSLVFHFSARVDQWVQRWYTLGFRLKKLRASRGRAKKIPRQEVENAKGCEDD